MVHAGDRTSIYHADTYANYVIITFLNKKIERYFPFTY